MAEKNNTERVTICLNRDIESHAEILEWMEAFEKTTSKNRNRAISRQIVSLLHNHVAKLKRKSKKINKELRTDESRSQVATAGKEQELLSSPSAVPAAKEDVVLEVSSKRADENKWSAPPETRNKASSRLTDTMRKMNFDDD